MKKQILIARIALGTAIAALIFSLVTLGKSIVLGRGVFLSLILILGTSIVVAICVIILRVSADPGNYEYYSDDEPDDDEEPERPVKSSRARTAPAEGGVKSDEALTADEDTAPDSAEIEREVDSLISELEKESSYDLSNFE